MASESGHREQRLAHFPSYEVQELQDLHYGGQSETCERFAKTVPNTWSDTSIQGDWTPDED